MNGISTVPVAKHTLNDSQLLLVYVTVVQPCET